MNRQYVLDRLSEVSTWKGIILIAAAAGVPIAPALGEQLIAVGIAIVGVINILTKEKK